jgi:S-adenosylmethionine hydrolase
MADGITRKLTDDMKLLLSARTVRAILSVSLLIMAGLAASALPAAAQQQSRQYPPTIVFMSDFGTVDDSVAICKGVMYSIAPDARIFDLTHQVKPYSILDAARFLQGATPYYPAGTVFVAVVDPGVGSERRAIVARSKRKQYFVVPDNGLITLAGERDGIEGAREITNPAWIISGEVSATFNGRDVFSPVAAHLARGEDWTQVGPELPVGKLVRLGARPAELGPRGMTAQVIATDGPYGNLITNVAADDFFKLGYKLGEQVSIELNNQAMSLRFVRTFSDVPSHQRLLYIDSRGRLALAVNTGNFAQIYHITPPATLFIAKAAK